MNAIEKIPTELESAIHTAVGAIAGHVGGKVTNLHYGLDFDGDECLNVLVEYPRSTQPADARMASQIDTALIDLAVAKGEPRYLFIRHRFTDGKPVSSMRAKYVIKSRRA